MTSTVGRLCLAAGFIGLALSRLDGSADVTSAGQAPLPAAATGAISGVVTDAITRQPIAGVIVQIQGGAISARAITDSRGRFVFRDLPASSGYAIRPTKPGYLSAGPVREPVLGRNLRIPLTNGEWIADLNVPMTRLGAISGTVVDERGEPLVGIPVRALVKLPVAGVDQLAAGPVTKTDDRGVYRLAGLARGRYLITVPSVQSSVPADTSVEALAGSPANALGLVTPTRTRPNADGLDVGGTRLVIGNYPTPPPIAGAARAYPVMFHPAARSPTAALTISLADGEEKRGVDVALTLETAVRVSGRVAGPPEATAGLVVRLMPVGSEGLGSGSEQATALTDASSRFTFLGVPPGSYVIDARTSVSELAVRGSSPGMALAPTPGFISETSGGSSIESAPVGTWFTHRASMGKGVYAGQQDLTVGGADVNDVTLAVRAGATITGHFVIDGAAKLGPPITVTMEPANGRAESGAPLIRVTADTSGVPFQVGGLLATNYFLRTTGGTGLTVKSIVAGGRDYTDQPFDMSSGADVTDVVVTLTDKGSSLAGTVRNRQGQASREAVVIIFPVDRALWSYFGLAPHRIRAASVVDQHGFTVSDLPAGEYHVVAVDLASMDAWHDPRFFTAAAPAATRVSLTWGATATQDLVLADVVIK